VRTHRPPEYSPRLPRQHRRPNPYRGADVHRLSRTAVQVSDGAAFFVRKARGGMALEDSLRRGLNRVRYRSSVG
jgi:hypothetical protein